MDFEKIMTTQDVAKLLHISAHRVGYLRKYGFIRGTRFGKNWLFNADDIKEFLMNSYGKDYANFTDMSPAAALKKFAAN